jgi:hypothetical protein
MKDISFVEKVKQFSRIFYQNYFVTNVFTHTHTHTHTHTQANTGREKQTDRVRKKESDREIGRKRRKMAMRNN